MQPLQIKEIEKIAIDLYDAIYCFLLSKTKDKNVAQDIVQQTYCDFFRTINRFEDRKGNLKLSIKILLFTFAHNKFITYYNKRKKEKKMISSFEDINQNDINEKFIINFSDKSYSPPQEISYMLNEAIDILNKLPKDKLSLMIESIFDGMTHEELSKKHKIPLGTIKSRMNRSRELFKKIYKHPAT